jgi:uncharacterized membrane protein YkvI
VVGTFLPYVHLDISVATLSKSIGRDGWQLGASESPTVNGGPLICVLAVLIAISAFLIASKGAGYKLLSRSRWRRTGVSPSRSPGVIRQISLLAVTTFFVLSAWSGSWKKEQYVVVKRSPLGLLSLVGVAVCLAAISIPAWRHSNGTQVPATTSAMAPSAPYVRGRRLNGYLMKHPIVRALTLLVMFGALGVFLCHRAVVLNDAHVLPWWSDSLGVVLAIVEFTFFTYTRTKKLTPQMIRSVPQLRVTSYVVMCAAIASFVVALPGAGNGGYAFSARYQVLGDLALLGFSAFAIVSLGLRPLWRER